MKDNLESFEPASCVEWRAWLTDAAGRTGSIWLVLHRGEGAPLTYEQVVEEALVFGWVDSKPNKLDGQRYKLWLAPRKPGSGWSRMNKERIERLIQAGQMTPADLAQAFENHPPAAQNFEAFPRSVKRGILEWISTAKKSETQSDRINETARLAAENIRADSENNQRLKH